DAHRVLEEAIAVAEDSRRDYQGDLSNRSSYFRINSRPYERLIQLYADEGNVVEALRCSERNRARAFLDALAVQGGIPSLALQGSERERDRTMKAELNRLV